MPTGINGVFFQNQVLTAKGLGAFGHCGLSDGILNGCDVTIGNGSVTIGTGNLVLAGRVVNITSPITVNVTVGSDNLRYCTIVAAIDLNSASTESSFEQVTIYARQGSDYEALANEYTKDDVNLDGTTYEAWFVFIDTKNGIEVLDKVYACGRSMVKLWENSNPTGEFNEGFVYIESLSAYNAVLVTFRRNYSTGNLISVIAPYEQGSSDEITYTATETRLAGSNTFTVEVRQRNFVIKPSRCRIWFTKPWAKLASGTSSTELTMMIPQAIYGLC